MIQRLQKCITLLAAVPFALFASDNTWQNGSGDWNDATHWKRGIGESTNISDDKNVYLTEGGVTINFPGAFNWGNCGVWYQIQLKNGLENPVIWTADDDSCGFTSDSESKYRHLAVGVTGEAGSLRIEKGRISSTTS